MLLDTIKRHDTKKTIKLVSIDAYRANNIQIPPQIHSVPALYLAQEKKIFFGKQVFDFLLLPGSGILLMPQSGPSTKEKGNNAQPNVATEGESEPSAYHISSNSISDAFTYIEDEHHPMNGMNDRSYSWTSISMIDSADATQQAANAPLAEETRTKKGLIDLDSYKAQRDLELKQSDLNINQLPPPSITRIWQNGSPPKI